MQTSAWNIQKSIINPPKIYLNPSNFLPKLINIDKHAIRDVFWESWGARSAPPGGRYLLIGTFWLQMKPKGSLSEAVLELKTVEIDAQIIANERCRKSKEKRDVEMIPKWGKWTQNLYEFQAFARILIFRTKRLQVEVCSNIKVWRAESQCKSTINHCKIDARKSDAKMVEQLLKMAHKW